MKENRFTLLALFALVAYARVPRSGRVCGLVLLPWHLQMERDVPPALPSHRCSGMEEARSVKITSAVAVDREARAVIRLPKLTTTVVALALATATLAESPNEITTPIPSPSIPAGPQPTATVTPLQTTPQPTATITPLPSAPPSDTQPQLTNTVTPSPSQVR